tara:strand:- start:280 stop:552 length:273 start_codon:yes stop_codon:yes gene_type:complete
MENQHIIIAIFLEDTCERTMEPLEKTFKHTYEWALDRIELLSSRSIHDHDIDLSEDSNAIAQEFYEWVNPEIDDQEVISLEYIGEGSRYE